MNPKKQIDVQQVQTDDRRSTYRRQQTQAHRLTIELRTPSGFEAKGELLDLSIRGASAKFVAAEKDLHAGLIVALRFGSFSRTNHVVARAKLMFAARGDGERICGFQFTDTVALQKQLDSFYGRFFNRRRSPRVGMPLDKKVFVTLFIGGNEVRAELIDLSLDGMQVRAPRAEAKLLDGHNHVHLRFHLPGRADEFNGRGAVLRRSQVQGMVTLGIAFDLQQSEGILKHKAALEGWIVHRTNEVARWDAMLNKPATPPTKPDAA